MIEETPRHDACTKSVRFALTPASMCVFNSHVTCDDVHHDHNDGCTAQSDLWYLNDDYRRHKSDMKSDAREFRLIGYGILLKDTFRYPSQDVQQCLTAFARLESDKGCSLRGCERYLNMQHDDERSLWRHTAVEDVVAHARHMKRRGDLTTEEQENSVAQMLHDFTQPCARFARRLGQADERAALDGEDSSAACRMIEKLKTRAMSKRLARWKSSSSDLAPRNAKRISFSPPQPNARTLCDAIDVVEVITPPLSTGLKLPQSTKCSTSDDASRCTDTTESETDVNDSWSSLVPSPDSIETSQNPTISAHIRLLACSNAANEFMARSSMPRADMTHNDSISLISDDE